jgi:hypothetical protein
VVRLPLHNRVLYLPYVTLIWGNSAENRKAEENAVKAITYRNTKIVYLSQYSQCMGQIRYRSGFWLLSVTIKRFFNMLKILCIICLSLVLFGLKAQPSTITPIQTESGLVSGYYNDKTSVTVSKEFLLLHRQLEIFAGKSLNPLNPGKA